MGQAIYYSISQKVKNTGCLLASLANENIMLIAYEFFASYVYHVHFGITIE